MSIFIKTQTSTNTATTSSTQTICDITAYKEACYTSNKNCAFVESQKSTNKYFACLIVQPKDCNFFCNYFNELNTLEGISSLSCVCNGIQYPTNTK
jgi:hypothetical protein